MLLLARIGVLASGVALIGFAAWAVLAREPAAAFLRRFASSARAHYTEQLLRLAAGAAIVGYAPETRFPAPFAVFGWLLVATAAALLLVPWRWHRRFGEWAIPLAIRYLRLHALAAFALGALLVYAAL